MEKNIPSWAAIAVAAPLPILLLFLGFRFTVYGIDEVLLNYFSPFWATVAICFIWVVVGMVATHLYHFLVRRVTELEQKK